MSEGRQTGDSRSILAEVACPAACDSVSHICTDRQLPLCGCGIDLAILLDRSGSITLAGAQELTKLFATTLVEMLQIGYPNECTGDNQVALVMFDDHAELEFDFNDLTDQSKLPL